MKKTTVGIFCVLVSCAWNVFGADPIISVDFGKSGKTFNQKAKGSFTGPLPTGVSPDYPNWNRSVATSEIKTRDNKNFLRFNVKKVDHGVFFRLSTVKIPCPGYYELVIRYRSENAVNLHIRQQKKPYKNFWEVDFNASKDWTERKLFMKLQARGHSAFNKTKLDSSRLVLYLSLKNGVTDIAYIGLNKIDQKDYCAALVGSIPRPAKGTRNYFNNSRFPLGPPSGWNINRKNTLGKVTSDASTPGPSGVASLKIDSPERITLYSNPFQTADLEKPVQVSFMYKAEGNWHVRCGKIRKGMPATSKWKRVNLTFQPEMLAKAYNLAISGSGVLYMDSLMACTGNGSQTYCSAGECEIALAPAKSDIASTHVQFSDENGGVKYYASGNIKNALLKARVVNIYGEQKELKAIALNLKPAGVLAYDVFKNKPLGPFRIEVWAERNGKRISPFNEIVMNRVRRPIYWGKDAPNSPFGGHFSSNKRILATMKAGGMNWERLNDSCMEGTCWGWLEPQRGKWVFADNKIARYRKAKIKILGYIGSAPEWASYYHGARHPYDYFNKMYQPKDIEAFKNYIRTVVEHYKGIIDEYQFQNEPWSYHFWHKTYDPVKKLFIQSDNPARDYVKLSKIAYREIKKIYPQAKMYGFNTSGSRLGAAWTKECFKDGEYDYCDMIDYHYYNINGKLNGFPGDPVSMAYNSAVGYIKENVKGQIKPVVMSEGNSGRSGSVPVNLRGKYPFTGMMKHSMPWKQANDPAKWADMTCRYVIAHLKLKVKRIFLYSDHCYNHMMRPPSFPVLLGADGYPHPVFSAFSNMAWLLEDRPFVKELKVGKHVWAYIFAGRGKSVAVITGWADGEYSVQENGKFKCLDLFGNRINGKVSYKGKIFYVISNLKVDQLASELKN